jgi:hypothetical protein
MNRLKLGRPFGRVAVGLEHCQHPDRVLDINPTAGSSPPSARRSTACISCRSRRDTDRSADLESAVPTTEFNRTPFALETPESPPTP